MVKDKIGGKSGKGCEMMGETWETERVSNVGK